MARAASRGTLQTHPVGMRVEANSIGRPDMHAAITSYIDVAQITLYLFWGLLAGVIYYLHQEDKREGYPLVIDSPRGGTT